MATGFFECEEGVKSSTRLISFLGCVWAMLAGSVLIYKNVSPFDVATFVSMIVGVFGTYKVASGALTEKPAVPAPVTEEIKAVVEEPKQAVVEQNPDNIVTEKTDSVL